MLKMQKKNCACCCLSLFSFFGSNQVQEKLLPKFHSQVLDCIHWKFPNARLDSPHRTLSTTINLSAVETHSFNRKTYILQQISLSPRLLLDFVLLHDLRTSSLHQLLHHEHNLSIDTRDDPFLLFLHWPALPE